jgi:hypothetical protein
MSTFLVLWPDPRDRWCREGRETGTWDRGHRFRLDRYSDLAPVPWLSSRAATLEMKILIFPFCFDAFLALL